MITLRLEPSDKRPPKVSDVISFNVGLLKSFQNFILVKLGNDQSLSGKIKNDPKALEAVSKRCDLEITELKYGSYQFTTTSTPGNAEQLSLWPEEKNLVEWSNNQFNTFCSEILAGNYESDKYRSDLGKSYTAEERRLIFAPLFSGLGSGSDYKVHIIEKNKQHKDKIIRTLYAPSNYLSFYLPKSTRKKNPTVYRHMWVITDAKNEKRIKKIISSDSFEKPVYPHYFNSINASGVELVLKEKLAAEVKFDQELFWIEFPKLNIIVSGESREEAIKEFEEFWIFLYKEYGLEENSKLTATALELKNSILDYIERASR
jgi:hypothetical protein